MVASQGLEPQQAESESAVLPLHHEASSTFQDWRGRRGSNPQPPDRQSSALTNCATTPLLRKVMRSISHFPCRAQGGILIFCRIGGNVVGLDVWVFGGDSRPATLPEASGPRRGRPVCAAGEMPPEAKRRAARRQGLPAPGPPRGTAQRTRPLPTPLAASRRKLAASPMRRTAR